MNLFFLPTGGAVSQHLHAARVSGIPACVLTDFLCVWDLCRTSMGSIESRRGIQIGLDREYIGTHMKTSKLNKKHIGNVYDNSKRMP